MWSLDYAIPSLMILSVIIGHYITLPRLPVKRNMVFVYLIVVVFSGIALDIISTWADMHHQLFKVWELYFFNSGYFIMFFAIAFGFFTFTASVLNPDYVYSKIGVFLMELPMNVGIILVGTTQWTKLYYYIDETGYHNGPLYDYLYLLWGIYIIFSFYTIYCYRPQIIRKREYEILVGCNIVLTIGLFFRYTFPSLLLMVIFILIAFIVIFLGFENPDNYLEERTLIFNKIALQDYIMELEDVATISAFVFCDKSYNDKLELYGIKQTNQGVYLVQDYLKKTFPKLLIFHFGSGRFVLFGKRRSVVDWQEVYQTLSNRFMSQWVSHDTEIWFDLGACEINVENNGLVFELFVRIFDEAFVKAEKSGDYQLQILDNSNISKILDENNAKRALDKAVEKNAVEVFLQPIIESSTGRLAGAEALARIRNSEGKIIPPDLFIPIAEKSGKINKLGKQVFKTCCDYFNNPDIRNLNLSFINVNLSPIQLMRNDLAETLDDYVAQTGTDREFIHLEITEESMIDEQMMEKQIKTLSGSGFKFVLDDYGKGYSNMSRLRKTPFINVKLDMSIVWDYCKNPNHILPSEINAFKKSGFQITAEGIEDEDMAKKMTELGCDYLQGYYYSKPVPLEEFIEKYKKQ